VVFAIVANRTGALLARGVAVPAAMTSGFHAGFVVSAGLVAAPAIAGSSCSAKTAAASR
jgi:hypothetical protein